MPKVRVNNLAISLDGYVAGPDQARENPLGVGGERLHEWVFETPTGRRMLGMAVEEIAHVAGAAGSVDDRFIAAGQEGVGATIMGRNMFGPIRGPWGDDPWTGWWGDDPPYHHPVFVLTHHPRPEVPMQGGTTFHFVTDGIQKARDLALEAASGLDVRLGGGASTVRQFMQAGLVDEVHLAVVPILLGGGERLFEGGAGTEPGYECVELVCSPGVAHVRIARTAT